MPMLHASCDILFSRHLRTRPRPGWLSGTLIQCEQYRESCASPQMIWTEQRLTTNLIDERRNDLHPETFRLLGIKAFRKARAIVRDRKFVTFAGIHTQTHRDLAVGIFGGVHHKFADNVSQRYSNCGRDFQRNPFNSKITLSIFGWQNAPHVLAEILKIFLKLD